MSQVLTWAKQHQQRLEAALSELVANAELLEELLAWIQWAETTVIQRDQEPMPQNIEQVKALIAEHQVHLLCCFLQNHLPETVDLSTLGSICHIRVTECNTLTNCKADSHTGICISLFYASLLFVHSWNTFFLFGHER